MNSLEPSGNSSSFISERLSSNHNHIIWTINNIKPRIVGKAKEAKPRWPENLRGLKAEWGAEDIPYGGVETVSNRKDLEPWAMRKQIADLKRYLEHVENRLKCKTWEAGKSAGRPLHISPRRHKKVNQSYSEDGEVWEGNIEYNKFLCCLFYLRIRVMLMG